MSEQQEERSFDWDDEVENDSNFIVLPAGKYPFEVKSFERAQFNGSKKLPACKMAKMKIEIIGGKLGNSYARHNFHLHSKTEGFICAFFKSIGDRKEGEKISMDWPGSVGKKGMANVGISYYNGKEYNEVNQFLDPIKNPIPNQDPTTINQAAPKETVNSMDDIPF